MKLNYFCIKDFMRLLEEKLVYKNPNGLENNDFYVEPVAVNSIIEEMLKNKYNLQDIKYSYKMLENGFKYITTNYNMASQLYQISGITIEGHNYLKQFQ